MELYLLTFNLIFGTSLIILYLVGLVAWKYYDKKQRLFRKDIIKRVSRHVNSVRKGEHHLNEHEILESNPPLVLFPLSREELYPFEKQETFHSHSHTPSSHRIRRSSIDYTHLHQSLHSSTSLHYDHNKWVKILWDLYELLPPVPYLSVLIQYFSDPVVFVERCSKIYGPCFSIYAWFGIKWTFMVGPDANRIFFSDIEGKQSNLFNPLLDYSKASEMLNKPFERSDILQRNHQACLPFISRRVRWHPKENETELKEEPLSKKQLLTEKEHLKQMLHEGFSSIQPLSEFVLENIRKEVKSSLFHLNHINLDFVDKNEMPAIAEADVETPKQLFGVSEDIFTEGLKKQQFNDQVLVMGDVFSHMSRFVIKSVLRSIFGSTFAKSHGDELSEIVSTLQVSCCDPLMICYYNFFRLKLLEKVWVPNKVYEIELKKTRLHELLFREIERHVKIYQFNMSNSSTKKTCLKTSNVNNSATPKTYACYMDYVLDNLGPNLSKYGSTIEHTMSLYAVHFEELILSVHKHEVTNLSWTICHLAQDQSLQDKVRKEIYQFQDELKNQMTKLISQKSNTEEYLSKFDHLNGVMNDNNFDEPRKELLEGIHTLNKEDLDLLNKVNSLDETPPTSFSANDISDSFASHTSLDTIPSESIGTLSSDPSSPIGFVPSPVSRLNDETKGTSFPGDQDSINYTEEQIITGELIPPHYLNSSNRSNSKGKTEGLTLPNMENLSLAAQAPMQSIAQSKNYDLNVETISPDLVHKGIVQKKLLFNALFVESVLSSSLDKQFESMHHSGLLNPEEDSLRLLDACFKESTRQYSLKFMTGKTTKHDNRTLRYFNYNIPSGQFVSIIPYFSHHSKEYFPFETHTYRPERFLELYHHEEKEETPTIEVTFHENSSESEKQQPIRGGPSEVSELSFSKSESDSIEEDRSLMNKLRVDQVFTQYGYVPCKSHQQIVKNGETIESNTSVLLDTCLGCNFINLSSRVFVIELLTHYKVELPQWQKADVSSNRYFTSESHDCAFPIHPVAIILNPYL